MRITLERQYTGSTHPIRVVLDQYGGQNTVDHIVRKNTTLAKFIKTVI